MQPFLSIIEEVDVHNLSKNFLVRTGGVKSKQPSSQKGYCVSMKRLVSPNEAKTSVCLSLTPTPGAAFCHFHTNEMKYIHKQQRENNKMSPERLWTVVWKQKTGKLLFVPENNCCKGPNIRVSSTESEWWHLNFSCPILGESQCVISCQHLEVFCNYKDTWGMFWPRAFFVSALAC